MATRRVHAVIRGVVQGVSYRASTQARATELGVAGWVRNRDDGSVELEAEGAAAAIDALLAWCARGPRGAVVDGVAVDERAPTGEAGRFRVVG